MTGTDLAARLGVDGYYVRIAPPESPEAASPTEGFVPIKNRTWPDGNLPACELVSPDALALVRFGLRAADDPRIVNTVRVVDALLKVDFPFGPVWRRYNGDGYGEHDDGSAFDGTGVGRPWPLLTGERAHFELAAGRPDLARDLMTTMEACANEGLLLPEQVWDGAPIAERELSPGRPSGLAMPLVWAHAEYPEAAAVRARRPCLRSADHTWRRYVIERTPSTLASWRFNQRRRSMPEGRTLRCETIVPAVVHWSTDGWQTRRPTFGRATPELEFTPLICPRMV